MASGVPDIDSFSTYGGAIVNYAAIEDPTTDRDGPSASIAYMNVAAMTRTATRAWCRVVLAATSGAMAFAASNPNDALWPSPQTTQPTLARSSAGVFTFTWPATVTDENGVAHTLNFRTARVSIEGSTWAAHTETVTGANQITVRMANLVAGVFTANDFVGTTILVEAGA